MFSISNNRKHFTFYLPTIKNDRKSRKDFLHKLKDLNKKWNWYLLKSNQVEHFPMCCFLLKYRITNQIFGVQQTKWWCWHSLDPVKGRMTRMPTGKLEIKSDLLKTLNKTKVRVSIYRSKRKSGSIPSYLVRKHTHKIPYGLMLQ